MKGIIYRFNAWFNSATSRRQKAILILTGVSLAIGCSLVVKGGLERQSTGYLAQEKFSMPRDIYMEESKSSCLIPLGEMKGELNKKREEFYLAIDNKGELFINRRFKEGVSSYEKGAEWQSITRAQFEFYEKHLKLVPVSDKVICK